MGAPVREDLGERGGGGAVRGGSSWWRLQYGVRNDTALPPNFGQLGPHPSNFCPLGTFFLNFCHSVFCWKKFSQLGTFLKSFCHSALFFLYFGQLGLDFEKLWLIRNRLFFFFRQLGTLKKEAPPLQEKFRLLGTF